MIGHVALYEIRPPCQNNVDIDINSINWSNPTVPHAAEQFPPNLFRNLKSG